MFKSLASKILLMALMLGVGSAATADTWPQGVKLNGVKLNGVKLNGVKLNGKQLQGQRTSEIKDTAARVTSITLADGTVLRAR